MAFECEHCHFRNSEVQMGGHIPDKGVRFKLRVERGDLKAHTARLHALCERRVSHTALGAPARARAVAFEASREGRHGHDAGVACR